MKTKTPSILIIWLSVILLSLIWGSTWLAIKIGITDTPPIFSASLRFIVASLFLIVYMKYKKLKFPLNLIFWKRSFILALFMFIIPYGLVYWGEMYISSGLSSVLFSSQSLFVVLFSHYILTNEKATYIKWLGLLIGMLGLTFIFYTRFELSSNWGIAGMIGILLAAGSSGYALVWLKLSGEKTNHIVELTSQVCITTLFFSLLSPFIEDFPQQLSSKTLWLSVGYLAIIGTSISFMVYYWLAKHTTVLILSFSIYFTPILALFLGWLFLGEVIGMNDIIGIIIVIVSIIITQMNKKQLYDFYVLLRGK